MSTKTELSVCMEHVHVCEPKHVSLMSFEIKGRFVFIARADSFRSFPSPVTQKQISQNEAAVFKNLTLTSQAPDVEKHAGTVQYLALGGAGVCTYVYQ